MKLTEGKYYRARNGIIFGPLVLGTDNGDQTDYYMAHDIRWSWNGYGRVSVSGETHPFDLIEEVRVTSVAPKTATFYAVAWWANDDKPSASIVRHPYDRDNNLKHGPVVTIELELPPKPAE